MKKSDSRKNFLSHHQNNYNERLKEELKQWQNIPQSPPEKANWFIVNMLRMLSPEESAIVFRFLLQRRWPSEEEIEVAALGDNSEFGMEFFGGVNWLKSYLNK